MKISRGKIPYGKWVKHFGGITIYYITFCTTLYFTTYKGHHLRKPIQPYLLHSVAWNSAFSPITHALSSSTSGRSHIVPFQYHG